MAAHPSLAACERPAPPVSCRARTSRQQRLSPLAANGMGSGWQVPPQGTWPRNSRHPQRNNQD